MPRNGDRERSARSARGGETLDTEQATPSDDERLSEGGGLRYQQAHRVAGATRDDGSEATAGARTELARESRAPEQTQRADEHGGPDPNDESWLQEQGYPKLGPKMQSRVTQVEHGPYAGGTQQGDTTTKEDKKSPR